MEISLDFVETLKKLVELQATDSGLDELEKLKKGFKQDIQNLENGVAASKNALQEAKKALENLQKERKALEIEIGALDNKIAKYLGQQNEVKSNEQFAALKHEIEKSKEEKGKLEEKVLEFLFLDDEQKKKIQALTQDLAAAEKKDADQKKALLEKIADCDKAALEKKGERQTQLSRIPAEFAEGYEALRNNGKRIAVAKVQEDMTCSGCHMNIPPQVLNEMKKNIAIQRCNCGRYLSAEA